MPGQIAAFTPGRINVWYPSKKGEGFASFDTLKNAQRAVREQGEGVVLDEKGQLDPSAQAWSGWAAYQANFPSAASLALSNSSRIWSSGSSASVASAAPAVTPPPKALAERPEGKPCVFVPEAYVSQLGVSGSYPTGVFFAFDTVASARAFIKQKDFGVLVDESGAVLPRQPWSLADSYDEEVRDAELTNRRPSGMVSAWFPPSTLKRLHRALPAAKFGRGAYVAFLSEKDAAAHVRQREFGVVLDAEGTPVARQPWGEAKAWLLERTNHELKAQQPQGKCAVWFPPSAYSSIGLVDPPASLAAGAFLAFDSEKEALAHARLRQSGVVLKADGTPGPEQPWYNAARAATQLLNDQLSTTQPAGHYAVWFPVSALAGLGLIGPTEHFVDGAYLSFDDEAQAQAHAQARRLGVVLDPKGKPTATQSWYQAAQVAAQLLNGELTPQRTEGRPSVWLPPTELKTAGVRDEARFPFGAYVAFDSEKQALAHATAREEAVVLLADGTVAAKQAPTFSPSYALQYVDNPRLEAQRTQGKWAVWFSPSSLRGIGVTTPALYPNGAYLSFSTQEAAVKHVEARTCGVVLDKQGEPAKKQPWHQAAQALPQMRNGNLTAVRTDGKFSVWLPSMLLGSNGVLDSDAFPRGAYLAFETEAEALEHAQQRQCGVVVTPKGQINQQQSWASFFSYAAANLELKPMAPTGWVSSPRVTSPKVAQTLGAPSAGSVAIGSVKPTAKGADVVVHLATVAPPDGVAFSIGAQLNGNWGVIFNVPDVIRLPNPGWHTFTLHLDYAQIEALLQKAQPGLTLPPDLNAAIGARYATGHNTGIPGWSQNLGTEKDAPLTLPARLAPTHE